jgi:hypothetical protein
VKRFGRWRVVFAATLSRVNLVGTPSQWLVTLADRSVAVVWADSVDVLAGAEDQRDYRFCALMDISPQDQPGFDVVARTPGHPGRVVVTVALSPRSSVASVSSA